MARPRRNDFLIPTLGFLFDSIAIECSFLLSYWLRFDSPLHMIVPISEGTPPLGAYVYGSLVVIPVWLMVFKSRNMYGARRNVALTDELFDVVKVVTVGMLIVMSGAFFYRAFSYSRVVFGLLWLCSILLVYFGRIVLYNIEKKLYRSGRELRNAVIIGSNASANQIYSAFHQHPLLGYRLAGYFADGQCSNGMPLAAGRHIGRLDDVPSKLVDENIELALLALDHDDHPKLYALMQECEGINVEFLMVPDILELMTSRLSVKEIEGIPFIKIKGMPMTTWGRVVKRAFDLIVSSVLLILCSPLFVLVGILIKLDSKGQILFRQERVGIDGRSFGMLKFRSMKIGAESETGPVWAKDEDPRRTSIGRFLRRTSLDELPQLINVVKGEMSLVGPRPERPHFVEQFSRKDPSGRTTIPKYLDRHRVKTGMTGWAQVNGLRGNTSLEERIKYDIYYIENWSPGFDVKILLKTIRALFQR